MSAETSPSYARIRKLLIRNLNILPLHKELRKCHPMTIFIKVTHLNDDTLHGADADTFM